MSMKRRGVQGSIHERYFCNEESHQAVGPVRRRSRDECKNAVGGADNKMRPPARLEQQEAGIFFFARRQSGDSSHHWGPPWRGPSHAALQILNERFVRGEIQKVEYEEKKAAILSRGLH
jgi:Short C-terminal domain